MKKQPTQQEIEAALERVSKNIAEKKRPLKEIALIAIDTFFFIDDITCSWGEHGEAGFSVIVSTEAILEEARVDGRVQDVNNFIKNKVRELTDYNLKLDTCQIRWVSQQILSRDYGGNIFHY